MSSAHLTTGSQEPPRIDGLLRVYSMLFCPFAQRSRLVLKAKQIPHDIVNINLKNKPEWYLKIHPEGKVPALLDGSDVIVESLDICDYLEKKFPQYPLYPDSLEAKNRDKEMIQKIGPLTGVFGKCLYSKETIKTAEEWVKEFLEHLQVFEHELGKRGTTFFGGEKPGMVDYMLWPWAERSGVLKLKLGTKLPIDSNLLPNICKWKGAMREDPVCSELYIPPEKHWQISKSLLTGVPVNYDAVL